MHARRCRRYCSGASLDFLIDVGSTGDRLRQPTRGEAELSPNALPALFCWQQHVRRAQLRPLSTSLFFAIQGIMPRSLAPTSSIG
jgi:hypothetical protein